MPTNFVTHSKVNQVKGVISIEEGFLVEGGATRSKTLRVFIHPTQTSTLPAGGDKWKYIIINLWDMRKKW